ncbi:SIR2 family protein [Nannocystis pusilla]|uniref:SIR2 family protein n=1 Tax=Nannocystis pusilla TaxID=889268 RepID=A0A9X3EN40_9BACT|nr:SIR2 family protein [Nannocystis pusilla]MCY1007067.1 SIR2 family protein [Nannocystis pusilla]
MPHLNLGQQRHYILQLHGTRTDRSSWVLGEREYEDLLHGRPELRRFVEGLFRFHPLLFVGYGLRDPDFDHLCGQLECSPAARRRSTSR